MSTITREQLRERARVKVKSLEFSITQTAFADARAELEEELELARIALASLEAEPVAYMYKDNLHADARFSLHTRFGNWSQEDINEYEITEIPLYTAPPAPASVPDEMDLLTCHLDGVTETYAEGWNAYRAAMLHGAAGSSQVIPDGWVACSKRNPEEAGRYWCYVEEQNDLGKSHYQWNCSWNGDRWWVESENGGRVTHWMPLPAAPQQEV